MFQLFNLGEVFEESANHVFVILCEAVTDEGLKRCNISILCRLASVRASLPQNATLAPPDEDGRRG